MTDLADFLQSHDPEVRIAAIRLLNAKFLLNPGEIVLNFSYFLPSFLAILQDKSLISYCQLTSKLVDVLISDEFDLIPPTVDAFLRFFKACCELSPQSSTIDAFVLGMFDSSRLYPAVDYLFARHSPADHLEVLFGLLVASQSLSIFKFVQPLTEPLCALALSNRSGFVPDLLKCLASPAIEICLFAAEVLSQMADDDSVLLRLLPHAGLLRGRLSDQPSSALSSILSALSGDEFRRRVFAQPRDLSTAPPAAPAALLKEPDNRSVAAEIAQETDFSTLSELPRRPIAGRPEAPQSLSRWLERPLSAQPTKAERITPSLSEEVQESRVAPRVAGIVAVVHKLGGFQRGTWQRRVFEYHPISKCVVWRKGRQSPTKGFVLVGPGVTVERVVKGVKGKLYIMEISTENTIHQLAFDTQGELDKWLVTLEAARVQQ
jgi:hypothetical protein